MNPNFENNRNEHSKLQRAVKSKVNLIALVSIATLAMISAGFVIPRANGSIMFSNHCPLIQNPWILCVHPRSGPQGEVQYYDSQKEQCITILNETMHINVDNAIKVCYKPNGNSSTAPLIPGVYN